MEFSRRMAEVDEATRGRRSRRRRRGDRGRAWRARNAGGLGKLVGLGLRGRRPGGRPGRSGRGSDRPARGISRSSRPASASARAERPGAVDQEQGLGGRRGRVAAAGAGVAVGGVERVEQRVAAVADDLRVDRPPRAVGVSRSGRRSSASSSPRDGQHRVADLLGVEPLDRSLPEQAVLGIDPPAQSRPRSRCARPTGDRPPRS